jgi:hypothetical protein
MVFTAIDGRVAPLVYAIFDIFKMNPDSPASGEESHCCLDSE